MRAGRNKIKTAHPKRREQKIGSERERGREISKEIKSRRKRHGIDTAMARHRHMRTTARSPQRFLWMQSLCSFGGTWQPIGSVRSARRGSAILMEHLSWFYTRDASRLMLRRHSKASLRNIADAFRLRRWSVLTAIGAIALIVKDS